MRRRSKSSVEMSLVPLADMLTNTVGIMIFVMIFAVLVAGGSYSVMHLPMCRSAPTPPVEFFCSNGTILPWQFKSLASQFVQGIPKFSLNGASDFERIMNQRTVSNDLFVIRAYCTVSTEDTFYRRSARVNYLALEMTPRPGVKAETISDIQKKNSVFQRELAKLDPKRCHLTFWTDAASIDVFKKAREIARARGFETGWFPDRTTWPFRYQIVPDTGHSSGGLDATGIVLK